MYYSSKEFFFLDGSAISLLISFLPSYSRVAALAVELKPTDPAGRRLNPVERLTRSVWCAPTRPPAATTACSPAAAARCSSRGLWKVKIKNNNSPRAQC